ncbi:hypothetical protein BBOV_II002200 [Babesia bovis T2Bo]|uniref:Uncharacterized protein n=1 Tax=Babesia bovis TaxID=5865 RepID=A7ATB5_BABBO|nr:hypothetical protein BBOV_II002200 [Babesia bovis T2Bo]EDO06176.1 hypothetical protein BBOV_II002200 [Babesia bovis T2Bo]|eukprot:XP_001609744.1 hypothetical protein [Babesia bovis T2Bo]
MRAFMHNKLSQQQLVDEDNVIGEILEDIECINIDDDASRSYDDLNDDTFGDGADATWDPTETFKEAEKPHVRRRGNKELVKCELFDFPEPQPVVQRNRRQMNTRQPKDRDDMLESKDKSNVSQRKDGNMDNGVSGQRKLRSPRNQTPRTEFTTEMEYRGSFTNDLSKYIKLGMFALNNHLLHLVHSGITTSHHRWHLMEKTLERHASGIERTKENMQKELFMDDQAFDQILRIHLTQICKDPRLQSYTGRWNTRHLNMQKGQQGTASETEEKSNGVEEIPFVEKKIEVNPNRFGKTSAASVRYGRKLIRLSDIDTSVVKDGPVSKDRQLRETIERGYEALYMLCDIEEDIEQCPMNHVAALDKMQKDREGKLNELFVSLTTGDVGIEDIMDLNKGRILMIKLGRKLSIETKLQLACSIVRCSSFFAKICAEVDVVLSDLPSVVSLIHLLASSSQLKPLVAFDHEVESDDVVDDAVSIHSRLATANSFTRCFLFIIEALTMTGHLFLLTPDAGGRETALQRCCNMILKGQQLAYSFKRLLSLRTGVIFMNVVLERARQNPIAVDKDTIDMMLHYTLEVSESMTTNSEEWKSLASTIMQMFH